MNNTGVAKLDSRGRIIIGNKLAKRYGKCFFIIQAPGEIILLPKPADPIKALQEWGRKAGLASMSAKDKKKITEDEAYGNP